MKVLFQNYTFNAAAKQITFNTTDTVLLENILLVTNVTDNQIIYNFANPSQGGSISNNVLTLTYDTTSMSNNDSLQIFLDLYGTPAKDSSITNLEDAVQLLRRLVQVSAPLSTQDSAQRQRVSLDAAPATVTVTGTVTSNIGTGTLSGVTTVSTLTSLNQLAGVDSRYQIIDWARAAYNSGIRANLISS